MSLTANNSFVVDASKRFTLSYLAAAGGGGEADAGSGDGEAGGYDVVSFDDLHAPARSFWL